jgi:hypothetical protein
MCYVKHQCLMFSNNYSYLLFKLITVNCYASIYDSSIDITIDGGKCAVNPRCFCITNWPPPACVSYAIPYVLCQASMPHVF